MPTTEQQTTKKYLVGGDLLLFMIGLYQLSIRFVGQ